MRSKWRRCAHIESWLLFVAYTKPPVNKRERCVSFFVLDGLPIISRRRRAQNKERTSSEEISSLIFGKYSWNEASNLRIGLQTTICPPLSDPTLELPKSLYPSCPIFTIANAQAVSQLQLNRGNSPADVVTMEIAQFLLGWFWRSNSESGVCCYPGTALSP